MDNKVLRAIVKPAREVAVEDGLSALGIPDLGVDRGTRHVRNHGIAAAPRVLSIAKRMVLGSGLREPNVTSVAIQVAGLDGVGDILLDNNGTAGGVDEPGALERQYLY